MELNLGPEVGAHGTKTVISEDPFEGDDIVSLLEPLHNVAKGREGHVRKVLLVKGGEAIQVG